MKRFVLKLFKLNFILSVIIFLSVGAARAQTLTFDSYHTQKEMNEVLTGLHNANPGNTDLITLAVSYGNKDMLMLEIGPETGKSEKTLPAVFVMGNADGTVPISTEAALYLADMLLKDADATKDLTWYILPCGNPDAMARYFNKPLVLDPRNDRKHNDDMDDQTDEDGFDDLDGNGFITQMRVKDPSGMWIVLEGDPRIMKRADYNKGEKGVFKLYSEGLDNDEDGEYNEDGPGGVNIGINYPHLFKPFSKTGGMWPGSENESYELMKFMYEHPEIAMSFTFGATNFCMVPPKAGRQGEADLTRIKIPDNLAEMFGADKDKTYTMDEIMELVQPLLPPGMQVTESMLASFLGLGAVVNPMEEDLNYYKELSEKYKEFLKENSLDSERLDPASAKDASFELWCYYHLGVLTFTMDLWTLPEVKEEEASKSEITVESLEKMSNEDFIALGKEKIGAFLKEVGAPENITAEMLIGGVESGQMTPARMAEMMKSMPKPADTKGGDPKTKALLAFSDKELGGAGFIEWKTFQHPTLGEVEIGGAVPFADNTPPESMINTLLSGQVPWVLKLADKLPQLKILKTEVTSQGSGVYEVDIWVENNNYLPFPTAMGGRNMQPAPAILILEAGGIKYLAGKKRTSINSIAGNKNTKLHWLIQSDKPVTLNVSLKSVSAWSDNTQIKLGGSK